MYSIFFRFVNTLDNYFPPNPNHLSTSPNPIQTSPIISNKKQFAGNVLTNEILKPVPTVVIPPKHAANTNYGGTKKNDQFRSPRSVETSSTFPATFAKTPVNLIQRSQIVKFYLNHIKCEPMGDKIDIILSHWFRDYRRLETNHGYIQWLFPMFSQGQNCMCPPLKDEEARCI